MGGKTSKLLLFHARRRENRATFDVLVHRDRLPFGYGLLTIQTENVVLLLQRSDLNEPKDIEYIWPIRSIRRYGADGGVFSIECGRRCQTGPGLFAFSGKYTSEMFSQLRDRVAAIEKEDALARMNDGGAQPRIISSTEVDNNQHQSESPIQNPDGQYINCDSQGSYRDLTSNMTLYDRPSAYTPSVAYADLDLSKTSPSSLQKSSSNLGSKELSPIEKCEYSVIDHVKTRAAASSSRHN